MVKILVHGNATIDHIVTVANYPIENKKSAAESFTAFGGGNSANTGVTLSRLGCDVSILSLIGDDAVGDDIISSFEKESVDCSLLQRKKGHSALALIIVNKENNTRTIINRRGPSYDSELSFDESVLNDVDAVYIDGRYHTSALRLAILAHKKKITVFVESERSGLYSEKLFPYADVVITSEDYHAEYFKSNDYEFNLQAILDKGPRLAVVTLGSKGSILKYSGGFITCPIYKVAVIDTTGAGDAFIGGFIFGYLKGWKHQSILSFASYVAAQKCTCLGPRAGLPFLNDVKEMIDSFSN